MIGYLEKNTLCAVHLRSPSISGGKDWIGCLTASGELYTFWGKTGSINQQSQKPGSQAQLLKLIKEKQAKGYRIVDEFRNGLGWQSQSETVTSTPQAITNPSPPNQLLVRDSQNTLAWDF